MAFYDSPSIVKTKCPFYIREAEYSITCEGIIPGTDIATRFTGEKEKREYQELLCYHYPNNCPIRLLQEYINSE